MRKYLDPLLVNLLDVFIALTSRCVCAKLCENHRFCAPEVFRKITKLDVCFKCIHGKNNNKN